MPLPKGTSPPARIQIENVWPILDCGRYPVKRTLGRRVAVWADIFRDGHEILRAWLQMPLEHQEADRWHGVFEPTALGRWQFVIEAYVDRAASWRNELERKVGAGQEDLSSELLEGAALLGVPSLSVEEGLADV